jgi:hypothetical protein
MLEAMMKANLVSPERAREAEKAKAIQARVDRESERKATSRELESKLASLQAEAEKLPYNEVGVRLTDLAAQYPCIFNEVLDKFELLQRIDFDFQFERIDFDFQYEQ